MFLKRYSSRIFALLLLASTILTAAQTAHAQLQVRLEQDGFASFTITDNGPADRSPEVGLITWDGPYGTFTTTLTQGRSKPYTGNGTTEARLENVTLDVSSSLGGTLRVTVADTGFTFPNNDHGNEMFIVHNSTGTMSGFPTTNPIPPGSSVTMYAWANADNLTPLATDPTALPAGSTAAGPLGPYSTPTISESTGLTYTFTKGPGPYSIFSTTVVSLTGAARVNVGNIVRVKGDNCDGKLGNFVWNDLDRDGIQDAGEPGIDGLTVTLMKNGSPHATTTTGPNGYYQFSGLCAATYIVQVPNQPGLTGFVASPTNQGGDAGFDSNPNPFTVLFPDDNHDDQTIDFGFYLPAPHLTLVKSPKGGVFQQGEQVSFSFLIGNDGGSPATNVQLTDQLPSNGGLLWMVAQGSPSLGSCSVSGTNLLTCNIGTIQPNTTVSLTVTSVGATPAAACQAQPNPIALVTGDGGLSAQDYGSLTCTPPPQLRVVKNPKNATFFPGQQITFTIDVSNPATAGSANATNVTLADSLPGNGGLVWATANATQGSCNIASNNLTCNLGSIAAGQTVTVTVTSVPNPPALACQAQPNPIALATADGGLTAQDSGSYDCTLPPPSANCVLINAVQGSAITPVTLTGTGGSGGPYTFSATGLPAGLTLASNGTISGTPTVSGTFTYTVTVTDKDGHSSSYQCSVTVNPPPSANCVIINAVRGTAITPVTVTGTGGTGGPYTFSATGLPAGLTMSSTGTISGTPTVTGAFTYTVTVTDKDGNTGTYQCSVTVNPPPLTAACVAAITGQVGSPYSSAISASGGTAPYTFAINSGSLPPGLTMNSSSGAITGTPTAAGPFAFSVKVTDSTGGGALTAITSNCGITVAPPPMTAACVAAGTGTVGVPYSSSIGVLGGTAPYTFVVATGSLPAGLTLNSATGVISGTPTAAGPFAFSVMVTDATAGVHAVATTPNCGITIGGSGPCVPGTFTFSGSTASTGTAGNIRPFSITGVSVKASAFSRTDGGTWNTAYLGNYGPGLGVTDGSESGTSPSHKVDNIGGRDNYVMFEFSTPVVLDRVFLDAIGTDSDIAVWIGTKTDPYTNHQTLSDAFLSTLTREEELTALTTTSRWAEVNGSALSGNVIVIAALDNDTSPEDEFKISKLELECPTPPPACSGKIGDRIWSDSNNNGIQDSGEPGIAGVGVQLKNGSTIVATTTTDSSGNYLFTNLCAGTYTVTVTGPSGYTPSGTLMGTNRSIDSNPNPSTVVLPANDSTDLTIDFGYVPTAPCIARTFTFTGDTATSGTAGNIRTFTVSGVSVKASAFSRIDSTGGWNSAYLGLYGPGLGVTDGSESGAGGTHKVDNMGGRDNYVLFEFSSPVTINRAFLDAIGTDSDIAVWVGTKTDPYNNHITLSDSVLGTLAYEQNETAATVTSRWADINGGNLTGNVVVIAALANDTSPEDEFKISKLETSCPTATCSGTIGDFVWKDYNGNGVQNAGELGLGGITVTLKKGTTVVATTVTNASGFYQFTGLCAGTYSVVVSTPSGMTISPANVGTDRGLDSNGSPATVTLSADSSTDSKIDFGFVPPIPPACAATRFTFTGNTSTTGTAGNTRTFTVNGVSVKVTAFSKTTGGTWNTAYLGLYGPGLGVTDGSENGTSPGHKVDNVGRYNYVMFEFSTPVVVNQAFLDSIGADADLSVWIGTKNDPFNNHITLSDSVLGSLAYEENPTSSTGTSRWADFNNTARSGNVLVLAAMVTDTTPEDEFKISKIDVTCP